MLVGRQNKPVVNHPSSSSNGLRMLVLCLEHGSRREITKTSPHVTIGRVNFQNGTQVFDCGGESVFCAQDACDALHSWH